MASLKLSFKFFSAILFFACGTNLSEAQRTIYGNVTDNHQRPASEASVYIQDSIKGTSTDIKEAKKTIAISDVTNQVNFVLQPENKVLEPIVISVGGFEASDKAKGASLTPIDALTVPGNGADIANSLRSLPGTQQIGEKEGLFVRGGTGAETKQFIDGALLPNPNYSRQKMRSLIIRGLYTWMRGKNSVHEKMWGVDKVKAKELLETSKHILDNNINPGTEPHWGKKEVEELLNRLK